MDFIVKLGLLLIACLGLVSLTSGQYVTIIPAEKNVKKFINDSYFVSCQTTDGSAKAEWFNPRNQKIDTSLQNRIRVEISFGVDLFLTRITTQDSGIYTCMTQRGRASFNLTVIRPIVFNQNHAEQSASEGLTYKMRCEAQGQSQPKIYWKVDNRPPQAPKYKVTKNNELIIHNVTQVDAKRNYVCRAMDMESPIPDSKTMNITLKVKMKPRMVPGARTEHWGVLGEWANLTCAIYAEPPARFEWTHRNRTLSPSDEVFILSPQENISILQVLVRHETKFGMYTCKARNEIGSMEKSMYLYKGQKPATPVLEIAVVAHDGARIKVKELRTPTTRDPAYDDPGKKGKALPIIGYVVQYKMMTRSDWKMANATKHDEGFVIKGLDPGITYQVRAASKNQASVGEFSHPITVITSKSTSWSITAKAPNIKFNSVFAGILNLIFLSTTALL